MQSRLLLAILLSSLASTTICPMSYAEWSPLKADSAKEVESTEASPELHHFHKLRKQMDEEAAIEDKRRKKRTWYGKKVAPVESASTDADLPIENMSKPPSLKSKQSAAEPLADEPGTVPARELQDSEPSQVESGAEGKEGEEKPKKPKTPGAQPTEDVEDAQYFIKRSQSYANKKEFQSALNYADKALELQPQNWQAWYQKALVYQLAGYDAAAARRYLQLISHRPDMVEARIAMGMLYRKHADFELAEKEYEAAIEHQYYSFPAHFNLANLYMDQNKMEHALKEYKICLKLQPNNALVHNNLGVIFLHRNYLEEAADEFRKASTLDSANKMFADNLNNAHSKIGQKTTRKPGTM